MGSGVSALARLLRWLDPNRQLHEAVDRYLLRVPEQLEHDPLGRVYPRYAIRRRSPSTPPIPARRVPAPTDLREDGLAPDLLTLMRLTARSQLVRGCFRSLAQFVCPRLETVDDPSNLFLRLGRARGRALSSRDDPGWRTQVGSMWMRAQQAGGGVSLRGVSPR